MIMAIARISTLMLLFLLTNQGLAQDLVLSPSIPSGHKIYNKQLITITCTTKHTRILVWENQEYIGIPLVIYSNYSAGTMIPTGNSDSAVVVYVTDTSNVSGNEMISCQLKFKASLTYPNFTITCRNRDRNLSDNVTYHITNINATDLELTGPGVNGRVCPGVTLNIGCTARGTSIIQWISPTLLARNNLYCTKDDAASRNTTVNGIRLLLNQQYNSHGGDGDDTQTLICNLTIEVNDLPSSLTGEEQSITCRNLDVDVEVNSTFIPLVVEDCVEPRDLTENNHVTTVPAGNSNRGSILRASASVIYTFVSFSILIRIMLPLI